MAVPPHLPAALHEAGRTAARDPGPVRRHPRPGPGQGRRGGRDRRQAGPGLGRVRLPVRRRPAGPGRPGVRVEGPGRRGGRQPRAGRRAGCSSSSAPGGSGCWSTGTAGSRTSAAAVPRAAGDPGWRSPTRTPAGCSGRPARPARGRPDAAPVTLDLGAGGSPSGPGPTAAGPAAEVPAARARRSTGPPVAGGPEPGPPGPGPGPRASGSCGWPSPERPVVFRDRRPDCT